MFQNLKKNVLVYVKFRQYVIGKFCILSIVVVVFFFSDDIFSLKTISGNENLLFHKNVISHFNTRYFDEKKRKIRLLIFFQYFY